METVAENPRESFKALCAETFDMHAAPQKLVWPGQTFAKNAPWEDTASHFLVTLTVKGKPDRKIVTDWSCGSGWGKVERCPAPGFVCKQAVTGSDERYNRQVQAAVLKLNDSGRPGPGTFIVWRFTVADIVSSLFSDADCGDQTFDDFCDNLGYDTDSRKALDLYLACQKAAGQIRALGLPAETLKALREGAAEY